MDPKTRSTPATTASRRTFLKSSAGVIAGSVSVPLLAPAQIHAAGSDVLRVGLVGCGGRGTGAASQALRADPNVRLTAMADAFADHLERSLGELQKESEILEKIDVPRDRQFVGFNAYRQLIDSGVDVVLLATPPHFRPQHLAAAIDAGKHVFAESRWRSTAGSPVGPGDMRKGETKGLSVVSGLCLRYSDGFRESVDRVYDGAIGDIRMLAATTTAVPSGPGSRKPDWSDMEWQMQLVLLHVALRRFQRGTARAFSRHLYVAHAHQYPVRCVGAARPAGAHRSPVRAHLRSFLDQLRIRRMASGSSATAGRCPAATTT
jgi:hypothetical protein